MVTVLSIPSRGYAACLACLGAVLEEHEYSDGTYKTSFQSLINLQKDQNIEISFKRPGKDFWEKGFAGGSKSLDGKEVLVIKLSKSKSELVSPDAFDAMDFKINVNGRRKKAALITEAPRVWGALMEEHSILDFQTRTADTIALIGGSRNILEAEARDLKVGLEGAPGEFVRISELVRNQQDFPHRQRCSVFTARQPCPPTNGFGLAVFDGAEAFLKMRNNVRNAAWLVLLDRSERGYADAVSAMSSVYHARRGDLDNKFRPGYRIPGVEILSFVR